jgi:UDP-N-acetylglucosamine/UDP-N-acetylgalactosamine diphosphorylase
MTPTRDRERTRSEADLRALCARHGQQHVFAHWERLDEARRLGLLAQIAALDLELVDELASLLAAPSAAPAAHLEPPPTFDLAARRARAREVDDARARGLELTRAGRVGYVLVAGGQASRLGYEGPNGAYPIGLLSGRTLFEIHARRLRAAARRHGVRTPWYVMTSPANAAATRLAFEASGWFGLDPSDVFFFSQAMLPALDERGKLVLAEPGELFLAPNGHGGVLAALADSGALADARARGVTTLSYFQVDNPLAPPCDPLFLGLHARAGARMSSKVVEKRAASEKVGVLALVDGRMGCVEYSDLPPELAERRAPDGKLVYAAGNIAVHAIEVDFVAELTRGGLALPWHLARKSLATVDEHGRRVERPGVKFETFVFDALARSPASVVLEVERELEFSPVKNKSGVDSPASAQADCARLFARWATAAGFPAPPQSDGLPQIEIDPLLAESAEELAARRPCAPRLVRGGHLYEGASG